MRLNIYVVAYNIVSKSNVNLLTLKRRRCLIRLLLLVINNLTLSVCHRLLT